MTEITLTLKPWDHKYLSLRETLVEAKHDDGTEITIDLGLPPTHLLIRIDEQLYELSMKHLVQKLFELGER